MYWDIFCKVIDNHGDIGVCWRLATQLAARAQTVRLRVDDATALGWMAPQGCPGVQVLSWEAPPAEPGAVVIEAFGCELPHSFQAAIAANTLADGDQAAWINLEYLTAESFAERCHGLPSPLLWGPAAGLTKHFFHPGFTPRTGGLLREPDLAQRQSRFNRADWLRSHHIDLSEGTRLVSLFCYEPPALDRLLSHWADGPERTHLLVTAGRAAAAVHAAVANLNRTAPGWNVDARLSFTWLPLLSQLEFDHLLWACDLNFVRGEDSLVRALWAGKPLVWQLYPQDDDAHHSKLNAFLDWLKAPPDLHEFHFAWNGFGGLLAAPSTESWAECVRLARSLLLAQEDLATQLLQFVGREEQDPR